MDRHRWSDWTAGWWTTSENIGLPPLAKVMGVGRQQQGSLPTEWEIINITPIHKKGSKTIPGNYRPISLTSVVGKVMESQVRNHLVNHMTANNLFCDTLHGFVSGWSCMTQLRVVIELWTEMLDNGSPVDAIYLDFRKAFDIVPHERLLAKLKAYGIDGTTKNWI